MSGTQTDVAQRGAYWPVPLARAVVAGALGLYVTFSADHSARLGLVLFGAFAIVSGAVIVAFSARVADRVIQRVFITQGLIGVVFGAAALIFNGGGLGLLLFLLPAFFAITGFLELYSGLRARPRSGLARDWLLVGIFTAVAALVFLLIPQSAVLAIGLLGAYAVMVGVYLAIGGLTLKWETTRGGTPGGGREQPDAHGSGSGASDEAPLQQPAESEI